MQIDVETCRDPDLLAGEVRRLQAVIESGRPTLTDLQRAAIEYGVMLCEATAGMANDRATIDGASRAADVLRGLIRQPQPTLTDEERDVLDRLAHDASYRRMEWTERVLRGLLSRLG